MREKSFFILLSLLIMVFLSIICVNYIKGIKINSSIERKNSLVRKLIEADKVLFLDNSLEGDLSIAKKEFDDLVIDIKKQRNIWTDYIAESKNIYQSHKSISPSNVNANLVRLQSSLSLRCQDNGISLPIELDGAHISSSFKGNDKFGFGFASYIGFWPSFTKSEANLLDIQAKIVKQIVDAIASSNQPGQLIELKYIKRESVGPTDKNHISNNLIVLPMPEFLIRQKGIIESLCFEISFVGRTDNARTFVNQLGPPFSVRKFCVERIGEQEFFTNSFPGRNELNNNTILPIIRDINSLFIIHLEYITKVHLDPNMIFDVNRSDYLSNDFAQSIFTELKGAF